MKGGGWGGGWGDNVGNKTSAEATSGGWGSWGDSGSTKSSTTQDGNSGWGGWGDSEASKSSITQKSSGGWGDSGTAKSSTTQESSGGWGDPGTTKSSTAREGSGGRGDPSTAKASTSQESTGGWGGWGEFGAATSSTTQESSGGWGSGAGWGTSEPVKSSATQADSGGGWGAASEQGTLSVADPAKNTATAWVSSQQTPVADSSRAGSGRGINDSSEAMLGLEPSSKLPQTSTLGVESGEVSDSTSNVVSTAGTSYTKQDAMDVDYPRRSSRGSSHSPSPGMSRDTSLGPSEGRSSVRSGSIMERFIESLRRGIRAQMELKEADAKVERWKTTQLSAQYKRCGRAARLRLDAVRLEYQKNRQQRYDALMKAATELAESDAARLLVEAAEAADSTESFQEYATSVRHWLSGVIPVVQQFSARLNEPKIEDPLPRESTRTSESESPLEGLLRHFDELELRIASSKADLWAAGQQKVNESRENFMSIYSEVARMDGSHSQSTYLADSLAHRVSVLGTDVGEEANHIAAVITEHRNIAEDHQAITAVNADIAARLAPLEEQGTRLDALLEEQSKDLERLRSLIASFRPTAPPASMENLASVVQYNAVAEADRMMRLTADSLSTEVGAALRLQQEDIYPCVLREIRPTLQVLQAYHKITTEGHRGSGDASIGQI